MVEMTKEGFHYHSNLGEIEQICWGNDGKMLRYDIVYLIGGRSDLWGGCMIVSLGDLGEGMGEIGGEVCAQC